MNRKRLLVLLCAAAVLVALIWPLLPLAQDEDRLASLPASGNGFDSVALPLSPADVAFLNGARAAIRRVKLSSGGNLVLTVIDGSGNRHAVHDPSYCLAGGGWKIREKKRVPMPSGEAIWMKMTKGDSTTEAIWFFDNRKSQFISPISYWAKTSARRITLGKSGSEPLLVTLRAQPGEPVDWESIRKSILPEMGFK